MAEHLAIKLNGYYWKTSPTMDEFVKNAESWNLASPTPEGISTVSASSNCPTRIDPITCSKTFPRHPPWIRKEFNRFASSKEMKDSLLCPSLFLPRSLSRSLLRHIMTGIDKFFGDSLWLRMNSVRGWTKEHFVKLLFCCCYWLVVRVAATVDGNQDNRMHSS